MINFANHRMLLAFICLFPLVSSLGARDLLTVAERSDYLATARYSEVIEFAEKLARRSERVRLGSIGTSVEGRSIPVLTISRTGVSNADEAKSSGKLVVCLFGNIHAGEVCGKEALLMLARELAIVDSSLLDHLIVAVIPILNPDGNERVSRDNRKRQVGPENGTGIRYNAQGLDLNRDWVKLEAPETRAFVKFLNEWDPAVIVDTHTTNGSKHGYLLTYASPKHPAGHPGIIEFVRDRMLPDIRQTLRKEKGIETFVYGNFGPNMRRWTTYPDLPRYGTPYRGLRGRLAILSEAYAYASFKDRVLGTLEFSKAILNYASVQREEVWRIIQDADRAGSKIASRLERPIALRTVANAFQDKVMVAGFEKLGGLDTPQLFELELVDKFEAVESIQRPFAYIVPENLPGVLAKIEQHGIRMDELREDIELDMEAYTILSSQTKEKTDQKHHVREVEVESKNVTRIVKAGAVVVRTAQPLGFLACYLLEPRSSDGLTAWNFLDEAIEVGGEYPILRLPREANLFLDRFFSESHPEISKRAITFEEVYEKGHYPGAGPSLRSPVWLDDDTFLDSRSGKLEEVVASTGRRKAFHDAGAMQKSLESLPWIDEQKARELASRTSFTYSADHSAALIRHENDLYYAPLFSQRGRAAIDSAVRLTSHPGREELATLSPDGQFVAFVRNFDLYVVDVATQTERALTTGGTDTLRHGKASWVYFEEVFGRDWKTFWWSSNSAHIAFFEIDSSGVDHFEVIDQRKVEQRVEDSTYPQAGERNPTARLGIVSVAGGQPSWADLSNYDADDLLLTGVRWTPDGTKLHLLAQNRIQTWLDILLLTPRGGVPVKLVRQTTEAWVDQPIGPLVLGDGSFLLTSEESGWKHAYLHDASGKRLRQITSGDWELRSIHHVDEAGGWLYLSGTKDSHIAENLYRAHLKNGALERLSFEPGSHRIRFSPGGKSYFASWSSHRHPARAAVFKSDGERVRTLDRQPARKLEEFVWSPIELFDLRTRDGFEMQASLMKPQGFQEGKKYPVWFMTYAGPHAPSIRNSWHGGRVWDQVLAQSGIIVFRCDPRSASGKGAVSAWSCYKRLGVQELEDIRDAISWLKEQSFVDGDRIGMSGHSYGGFMTAYAMTHSDMFRSGIAGAPVTDWRLYDTIYTERYMQTPQLNESGYDETSVVKAAENLEGDLLILHGSIDDNVHLQNTLQLSNGLQQAGKMFDMMIYPGSRHGIHGTHYSRLRYRFIQRTVGGPPLGE